jgi:hypothetical protein
VRNDVNIPLSKTTPLRTTDPKRAVKRIGRESTGGLCLRGSAWLLGIGLSWRESFARTSGPRALGVRIGVSRDRVGRSWQCAATTGFVLHSPTARCGRSRRAFSLNCSGRSGRPNAARSASVSVGRGLYAPSKRKLASSSAVEGGKYVALIRWEMVRATDERLVNQTFRECAPRPL